MMNTAIANEFDSIGDNYESEKEYYTTHDSYTMSANEESIEQVAELNQGEINEDHMDDIENMRDNHNSSDNKVDDVFSSFPPLTLVNQQLESALDETKHTFKVMLQELVNLQDVATKVKTEWGILKTSELQEAARLDAIEPEVHGANWNTNLGESN